MTHCLSRLALAQLKIGDLDGKAKQEALTHIEGCERCRGAMADMDANVAHFDAGKESHREKLMARLDAEGSLPAGRQGLLSGRWGVAALAAAGIAAAAVALIVLRTPGVPPTTDGIRFKGTLSLQVVAKRDSRQFTVTEGTTLVEDDALRFVVTTGSPGYLQVFSVDAKGSVAPFYPESDPSVDPSPLNIDRAGRHELPGSVILDDSVGRERIVVVFSEEVFNRAEVIDLMTSSTSSHNNNDKDTKTFSSEVHVQILSIDKRQKTGQ